VTALAGDLVFVLVVGLTIGLLAGDILGQRRRAK
jgi:hypothetical protein